MRWIKSLHEVVIPRVLMKFGIFKVLSCQFRTFRLVFQSTRIKRDVKYEFALHTYYCNASTSLPLLDGQSYFIDCWTTEVINFWLCWFICICDVRFCHRVVPHWAGPMICRMVTKLMTNSRYDSWATGLQNSAVQMKSRRRRMSRFIRSNRTFRARIHWSTRSIVHDLYSESAQITNIDTVIFGRDRNL